MGDIAGYAQRLSLRRSNITMPDLDEALRRVAQYCMRTAFGFETPTEMEVTKLNEIFRLRNLHQPYTRFFKDHISDDIKVNQYIGAVNFKAGMNDFVSLLGYTKGLLGEVQAKSLKKGISDQMTIMLLQIRSLMTLNIITSLSGTMKWFLIVRNGGKIPSSGGVRL